MQSKRQLTSRAVIAALVAGLILAAALVVTTGFTAVVAYILGFGLITFLAYGYDKWQARRGGRRVTEPALMLMSVIGGALGGWAGMLIWRHKTKHAQFWAAQVIGTIVIVVVLVLV